MGLFSRKAKPAELVEAAAVPAVQQPVMAYAGTSPWSGAYVDEWTTIRSLAAFWRGLNIICSQVATTPFKAYRSRDLLDPQPAILTDPSPGDTLFDVKFQLAWSLVVKGNAFAYLYDFDRLAYPRKMLVLNPDAVSVTVGVDGTVEKRISGELVPEGQLLHIRGPRPPGSAVGVGVLAAQRDVLGHALAQEEYSARYFSESGVPSGTIDIPGQLDADQAKALRDEWVAAYANSHHLPAVMANGAKFSALSVNPEDQQLLEARKWSATEVALALGIPPRWLAGVGDAFTYANLEAENAQLVQFGLREWTTRIEEALTALLPRPQFVKANFDALLRSDTKTRYEAYRVANPTATILTEDEIRSLEDRGPVKTGEGQ